MKLALKILAVIFASALCVCADSPGVTVLVAGGTNNVAASATNTLTAFATSEFDNVGLQFSFKGTGAGTSNIQLLAYRSLDNTTYETTPFLNSLVALNGTTLVNTMTNLNLPSTGYLKIVIGNTNASVAVTNLGVVYRFNSPRRR